MSSESSPPDAPRNPSKLSHSLRERYNRPALPPEAARGRPRRSAPVHIPEMHSAAALPSPYCAQLPAHEASDPALPLPRSALLPRVRRSVRSHRSRESVPRAAFPSRSHHLRRSAPDPAAVFHPPSTVSCQFLLFIHNSFLILAHFLVISCYDFLSIQYTSCLNSRDATNG